MKNVLQRLLTLVVVCSLAPLALAQTADRLRDRDPELRDSKRIASELQQANLRVGPFYLLSRLRIADVGYSESFYLPTGDHSDGLAVSIDAPQRLYFVPHRKAVLTAELVPGYSFFSGGDDDGQFNYLARGDAHFLFNHLYLDLYTQVADQLRARVSDINRLATVRDEETGIRGEIKYSSRTSALFSTRYTETSFPSSRRQPTIDDLQQIPVNLLDRDERNGRLSLHHKTFPLTSLFVAAEASDYAFRRATYKDSNRTSFSGGLLRDAGRTSARVEVGTTKMDFDDPSQRDFTGITGAVSVTRENGRWRYAAGAERDLGFSILLNNNYYIAHTARLHASYSATRRLTLRTGTQYERDDYDVPVFGHRRRDTISFTTVGFIYAFRRINAGLDVGWYDRDSTFGGDTDSGIRTLLHLSFNQ